MRFFFHTVIILFLLLSCGHPLDNSVNSNILTPTIVTERVKYDTDDPAIWINPLDSSQSLVIGTDKDIDGGLFVFNLNGKIVNKVSGLKRPNNVDIIYDFLLNDTLIDIAVCTERETHKIRVFSFPDLVPIDNGGIYVFEGENDRDPMGLSLYKRTLDEIVFVIVGRKTGPSGSYLWQYELLDDGQGAVTAKLVRKFGDFKGKEIESIAVDNELGYVYYSDEGFGIHKYHVNPDLDNNLISVFGKVGFKDHHEGISIYNTSDSTGYILVSNQQANTFMVYTRENDNKFLKEISFSTLESDGSEVSSANLGSTFPEGIFVAMSNDKSFHYYDWRLIKARL